MSAAGALLALGAYTVSVFVVAALLAVPLHGALVAVGGAPPPLHELSADLLKLTALALLWPLLRLRGLRGRAAWGLRCRDATGARRVATGLLLGTASLGVVVVVLLAGGVRVLRPEATEALGAIVARAAAVAVLVACVEEIWFRGALQGVLAPMGARAAWLLVAVIFAALHFLRPDLAVAPPHAWSDGLVAVGGMFGRMRDLANIDSFLALLLAGLVLGWLRLREGCVAGAVGCHAGWVLVIQVARRATERDPHSELAWLVGRHDGIIGWAFIATVAAGAAVWLRRRAARGRR